MKHLIQFVFLALVIGACSKNTSQSETSEEQSKLSEEAMDETSNAQPDLSTEESAVQDVKIIEIGPNLLKSELQPYNITSYYKFYVNDLEKANQVIASKWDPNSSPGDDGSYDDQLDILDINGGYMKVVTPVADGFIFTEYVYWNLSDERILFGMNKVSTEPFSGESVTDDYEFRIFGQNQWAICRCWTFEENYGRN